MEYGGIDAVVLMSNGEETDGSGGHSGSTTGDSYSVSYQVNSGGSNSGITGLSWPIVLFENAQQAWEEYSNFGPAEFKEKIYNFVHNLLEPEEVSTYTWQEFWLAYGNTCVIRNS